MQRLLGSFIRWLVRHFVSLLVIVTILLAANFIQKEFKDLASLADMLSTLRSGKVDIGRYVELQKQALADRVATFNKDSAVALNSQIARVDDELRQKRTAKRPPLTRILSSLTGEGLVNDLTI
jgi:biopolymer transport protein ExbB/TolQ